MDLPSIRKKLENETNVFKWLFCGIGQAAQDCDPCEKETWSELCSGPSFCLEAHSGCSAGREIPSRVVADWTSGRLRQQKADQSSTEDGGTQENSSRNLSRVLLETMLNTKPCICGVKLELASEQPGNCPTWFQDVLSTGHAIMLNFNM